MMSWGQGSTSNPRTKSAAQGKRGLKGRNHLGVHTNRGGEKSGRSGGKSYITGKKALRRVRRGEVVPSEEGRAIVKWLSVKKKRGGGGGAGEAAQQEKGKGKTSSSLEEIFFLKKKRNFFVRVDRRKERSQAIIEEENFGKSLFAAKIASGIIRQRL